MQQITFYRHGVSVATVARQQEGGGKRGEASGWSKGASRRNIQFLRSIDERRLDGVHFCISLTLRDCPPNAAVWEALRLRFVERMRRAGMIRLHWVVELQRRGVPHLHGLIGFPDGVDAGAMAKMIVNAWLQVTAVYKSGPQSQHVREWDTSMAWAEYLGKHSGRRGAHYQRSGLPEGWEKSGRVWGHLGEWPLQEPERLLVQNERGNQIRRVMRSYSVAVARQRVHQHPVGGDGWSDRQGVERIHAREQFSGSGKQLRGLLQGLRFARRMLQARERKLGEVRGVSEWSPPSMNEHLATRVRAWAEVDGREASPSRLL